MSASQSNQSAAGDAEGTGKIHWERESEGFRARQISEEPDVAQIELTARYPTDWRKSSRNRLSTMTVLIERGRVALNMNGHETIYRAGETAVVPAGTVYSWKPVISPVLLRVESDPPWSADQHETVSDDAGKPEPHAE